MKTFILDADHNITAYASQQEASKAVPAGDAFATATGLKAALKNYAAATAAGIWNRPTGVSPVRKFKVADTAARRIFGDVQKLDTDGWQPRQPRQQPQPKGRARRARLPNRSRCCGPKRERDARRDLLEVWLAGAHHACPQERGGPRRKSTESR
jgi:hypothetical protein